MFIAVVGNVIEEEKKKANPSTTPVVATTSAKSDATATPKATKSYKELSTERFKEIEGGFDGELDSITCYNNDCSESVVYFNFNKKTSDFDLVIRSNAATFSKFKKKHVGTSHVTVIGVVNGTEMLSCSASGGSVSSCK